MTIISISLGCRALSPFGVYVPVKAEAAYKTEDPYAITFTFTTPDDEEVAWSVSRSLIAAGLEGPSGEGDFRLEPDEDKRGIPFIRVLLTSPNGAVELHLDDIELRHFVSRTKILVPPRHESAFYDIDAEIEKMGLG